VSAALRLVSALLFRRICFSLSRRAELAPCWPFFLVDLFRLCNFALPILLKEAIIIMALWRFIDYCSPAGNNLIEDWYWNLPEEAQAEFDAALKILSITEEWRGLSEFVKSRAGWIMRDSLQGRQDPISSSRIFRPWSEMFFDLCRLLQKGQNLCLARCF
jgi:hypothetical protein